MKREKINRIEDNILKLINANEIWITMYGMHKSKDCAIKIKTERISNFQFYYPDKCEFTYVWGSFGSDRSIFSVEDYGETWALTKEELLIEKGGE